MRDRKDYTGVIRRAFLALGLKPAPSVFTRGRRVAIANDAGWDVLWGLHWSNLVLPTETPAAGGRVAPSLREFRRRGPGLRRSQILNMVPGIVWETLCTKDALQKSYERTLGRLTSARVGLSLVDAVGVLGFLLPSFRLPEQRREWVSSGAHVSAGEADLWMLKPLNAAEGRGIRLIERPRAGDQVPAATLYPGGETLVAQQYVANPLTFRGHKFDLRVWALLTSVTPLRVYLLPDAYVRVASTVKFDPGPQYINNRCMHVTNGALQRKCRESRGRAGAGVVLPHPHGIWDPRFGAGLQPCELCNAEQGVQYDVPTLWQRVKRAVVKTLLMVLPELREFGNRGRKLDFLPRCFQFLSFDVLFDAAAQPFVIEVNADGYMKGGLQKVRHPEWGDGFQFTKAMLELVGVRGYDRSGYQRHFEELVASFCANPRRRHLGDGETVRVKCTPGEMDVLQTHEDEWHHRGGWERIWPPHEWISGFSEGSWRHHFFPFLDNGGAEADDEVLWDWLAWRAMYAS